MSKFICYTAILGGFPNQLHRPPQAGKEGGAEFWAFVDDKSMPDGCKSGDMYADWKLVSWPSAFDDQPLDPRREARRLKVLAHTMEDVDYSLWVDGCLTPLDPVWQLVDLYLNQHDICVFEHAQRGCLYKELEACLRLKKDDPGKMRQQVARYREAGYPHDNGLAETTAVLRRHNDRIKEFNEEWWSEIQAGSCRDQLSFNFVMWNLGWGVSGDQGYTTFEGNRTDSPHFKHRLHR